MLQQAGFGQICSAATDYHATTANAVLLCSLSTAVFFFQMWPSNAVQNSSTRRQSRLLIRTVEIHWRHSVCIKDFAIIFHLFIHHNNKNSLVQRKQNCHVHKSLNKKRSKRVKRKTSAAFFCALLSSICSYKQFMWIGIPILQQTFACTVCKNRFRFDCKNERHLRWQRQEERQEEG